MEAPSPQSADKKLTKHKPKTAAHLRAKYSRDESSRHTLQICDNGNQSPRHQGAMSGMVNALNLCWFSMFCSLSECRRDCGLFEGITVVVDTRKTPKKRSPEWRFFGNRVDDTLVRIVYISPLLVVRWNFSNLYRSQIKSNYNNNFSPFSSFFH
jgi:hypothetical protein